MYQELAAAIVKGLIAGATNAGTKAVGEVYEFARSQLRHLIPAFAAERVGPKTAETDAEMLTLALARLEPSQLQSLAEAFHALSLRLPTANDHDRLVFSSIIHADNIKSPGGRIEIDTTLVPNSRQEFKNMEGSRGVKIKTRSAATKGLDDGKKKEP